MSYARWATREELLERLQKINPKEKVEKSGIPLAYDNEELYIDDSAAHNLIIGATGSGKTQTTILPMMNLAVSANESIVINDPQGEIYEFMKEKLNNAGYNTVVLNFEQPSEGNKWNPLSLAQNLYRSGNKDKASKLLDDIGYYVFEDKPSNDTDPFWTNSTINLFTGLALYLFENFSQEVNLSSIIALKEHIEKVGSKEFMKKITKGSEIYSNLSGTLLAPSETKGSIMSVFYQKIREYISRENTRNMLSTSNFDIKTINQKPTALFIISGVSSSTNSLIPLLISQIIDCISLSNVKDKRVNVFLDEFDTLMPIRDFSRMLEYSRSINVRITALIKSYIHLSNIYSKEETEILKMCFGNIIYLLSNDIYTLNEVSKQCGNKEENGRIAPLITPEELKVLEQFEAVLLLPRMMPVKTKILPNYKINWD